MTSSASQDEMITQRSHHQFLELGREHEGLRNNNLQAMPRQKTQNMRSKLGDLMNKVNSEGYGMGQFVTATERKASQEKRQQRFDEWNEKRARGSQSGRTMQEQ